MAKGWFAVFAPKGTPVAALDAINSAVGTVLSQPPFIERLKELGTYPMPQSRQQGERFVQAEKVRWEKVIRDAGVKAE
ncbi:Tripartite tricarboxylate transporter family receptor [compost metagenome]